MVLVDFKGYREFLSRFKRNVVFLFVREPFAVVVLVFLFLIAFGTFILDIGEPEEGGFVYVLIVTFVLIYSIFSVRGDFRSARRGISFGLLAVLFQLLYFFSGFNEAVVVVSGNITSFFLIYVTF